ncbi:hypothetical protein [Streptomyces sp. NPDC097981]|uniref:hypothetical protein n=1 Tax=Streptomyces sp. NPDC097981 TaxID=3155428 RepID=UPI0033252376
MTTAPAAEPLTVRALLLGSGEQAPDALAETLHAHRAAAGVLPGGRGLTPAAEGAVERELATVVNGFLDLDLVSLVASGWSRYQALKEAARRTRRYPGSEEVFAPAGYSITSAARGTARLTPTTGIGLSATAGSAGSPGARTDPHLVRIRPLIVTRA